MFSLTTPWANSADDQLAIFFSYISQQIGFDMSCKPSPLETLCMECQILFSEKNKEKYYNMSSAEKFTQNTKL